MVDEVLANLWKLKRNAGNISKNINMDYMQAATEIVKVFIQKPSPSPGELLNQCFLFFICLTSQVLGRINPTQTI